MVTIPFLFPVLSLRLKNSRNSQPILVLRDTRLQQFLTVLFALSSAVCLVGLLGVRFALSQVPIWEPTKLIPIVGMLLGNAISGVAIGTNHCLTQVV